MKTYDVTVRVTWHLTVVAEDEETARGLALYAIEEEEPSETDVDAVDHSAARMSERGA